jgi:ankyrin repeat protein
MIKPNGSATTAPRLALLVDIHTFINSMSSLYKQLMKAAFDGKLVDVKRLVQDEGADVNFKGEDGSTALYVASMRGRSEVVRFLVENGADVHCKKNGNTALHFASMSGHAVVVRFLVENGADIDCKNTYGQTPLHYANSSSLRQLQWPH